MPNSTEARRALIESQRKLEQVADDFEQVGELERAFDCFQILLKLGKESAQFENLAEGYVNCIRVLRDDNLKFYVLQYYEDFIKLALERGELHAAATLYQEAAAFAARAGLPYDRHYQHKSALTWMKCAEQVRRDRRARCRWSRTRCSRPRRSTRPSATTRRCASASSELAGLELPERAKKRFSTIAQRYKGLAAPPVELPGLARLPQAAARVRRHLVRRSARVGDGRRSVRGRGVDRRRPALSERHPPPRARRAADARRRADAQRRRRDRDARRTSPSCSASCSRTPRCRRSRSCSRRSDPAIRRAAVRALRFLYFKRSFVIVRKALADPDAQVREAALVAIGGLHFPHAFNPLARIYRESTDPRVRGAALQSIGKIQTVEAGEFLVMVLRQESRQPARGRARRRSPQMDNADVLPILRQHHEIETNPQVRETLGELLRRR